MMKKIRLSFLLLLCGLASWAQEENPAVYPFAYQGEWGLIDSKKNVVLEPQLDYIHLFRGTERPLTVAVKNGRQGLMDPSGTWVLKAKYDSLMPAQWRVPHLRWSLQDGEFGLISTAKKKAKWVFKPQFTTVSDFTGRKLAVAVVTKPEGMGAINAEGEVIADFIYDNVQVIDEYSDYPDIKLTRGETVSYIDSWGAPRDAAMMAELEEDMIAFEDMAIDEAVPPIGEPKISYQRAGSGNKWQVEAQKYDFQNRRYVRHQSLEIEGYDQILEAKLDYSGNISHIQVEKDGLTGFLDGEGTVICPVVYDRVRAINGRYATGFYLHKGDLMGYASSIGYEVLPGVFTKIEAMPGRMWKVYHPDGYIGYARKGVVYLPIEL